MSISTEHMFYENATLWKMERFDDLQQRRVKATIDHLPKDACEILDLGCGNGFVTSQLRQQWKVIGLDRSFAALQYAEPPVCQGDALHLPFRAGAFDAVLTAEVIEHIPQAIYQFVLSEIVRVARRYIIVSVPYQEDLRYFQVTCPSCRCIFSPTYHMRAYFQRDMEMLFDGFKDVRLVKAVPIVVTRKFFLTHSSRSLLARLKPGYRPFGPYSICPQCGYTERQVGGDTDVRPLTTSKIDRLVQKLPLFTVRKYRWWLGFYEKLV